MYNLPLLDERSPQVQQAVEKLATTGTLEERGAVFTRKQVVSAILDLCEYTADRKLNELKLLEPSFGDGEFLFEVVRRLVDSFHAHEAGSDPVKVLSPAVRGVELHRNTYARTRGRLIDVLFDSGLKRACATRIVDAWLINDDFLLTELHGSFDVVVGNPPYVRQERIPATLLSTYRRRFRTMYDRADLYVPFYERGLDLLAERGVLGFICANRWLKNKYGGPLRAKATADFNLRYFIDMSCADAFHGEVDAYPAITLIERAQATTTLIPASSITQTSTLASAARALRKAWSNGDETETVIRLHDVGADRDPWLLDTPEILPVLRLLEACFPSLEASGAKVGIGVATGADRVFIDDFESLPVEAERKLRLALAGDCSSSGVAWSGQGIVNPYATDGLVTLDGYPAFSRFVRGHAEVLKARHVARKRPDKWYRTIDRIHPSLVGEPKLLIPDIKGEAIVAYDEGRYYPHHNLYVITSDGWDLEALQAILRSSIALMFVAAYCVRMSGGFLRFQAQYLRRIRCPHHRNISSADLKALRKVSKSTSQAEIDRMVFPLFNLDKSAAAAVVRYANCARVGSSP